ncbi:MAG: hypothetical protein AAF560_07910 [Acidobacteriota bacterium]
MRTEKLTTALVVAFSTLLVTPNDVRAQGAINVAAEDVECLPIGDNGVAWGQVENNVPDTTVRLNFRRMHDAVEDLYYVHMKPGNPGRYWGVFPKAEDRQLNRHELIETREEIQEEYRWAAWWKVKEITEDRDPNDPHDKAELDDALLRERASLGRQLPRDWLAKMDEPTFQDWLEQLENEPAEYYVSVHDADGRELARSATKVTEVRENCRVDLSPQERGVAENLTVGETAHWQRDEEVFHWLCDGIVTRIDPTNVLRGDGICRACVIAWYKKKQVLLATALVPVSTGVIIDKDPQPPVSQDCPTP